MITTYLLVINIALKDMEKEIFITYKKKGWLKCVQDESFSPEDIQHEAVSNVVKLTKVHTW